MPLFHRLSYSVINFFQIRNCALKRALCPFVFSARSKLAQYQRAHLFLIENFVHLNICPAEQFLHYLANNYVRHFLSPLMYAKYTAD